MAGVSVGFGSAGFVSAGFASSGLGSVLVASAGAGMVAVVAATAESYGVGSAAFVLAPSVVALAAALASVTSIFLS